MSVNKAILIGRLGCDPANKIGSVMLPTECVEQHLDSMRDAIDAAMRIQAAEAV